MNIVLPILLRPHHFLCIKGYKGFNYSQNQIGLWDRIIKYLNDNPYSDIFISSTKDSLCSSCPASKNISRNGFVCFEKNIKELDKKVRKLLGVKIGGQYKYADIVNKMNKKISNQIHQELCSKCFWWQKGLCQDSFKKRL